MSPVNEPPTPLISAARKEAAYTVNSVTTATPIASAVAAAAVRPGLRWALRRARVPVTPRHAASGRPSAPVTGRATAGPRRTTPVVVSRAPSPTVVSTPLPEPRRPATIRVVAGGEALLSPTVTRRLVAEFTARAREVRQVAGIGELTPREREVVALVADGLSNAEIAGRWHVSESTVKTHVNRAMMKLAARDRAQLVVLAYQSGLARAGW